MNKRRICRLLAISMLLTGTFGINSYASEQELYIETLETEPVVLAEEPITASDSAADADSDTGSDSESYTYSEADAGEATVTPMKDNTEDEAVQSGATEVQEATGESSMPDMDDLDIITEDIINIVLPVIPEKTYDFTMDPKDLISRYGKYKDNYDKASLYFTNIRDDGEVFHSCRSDAALAINKSTVPVLLNVSVEIENEYEWPVKYTDMDSVEGDEDMNLSFSLIPVLSSPENEGQDAGINVADNEEVISESEVILSEKEEIISEDGPTLTEDEDTRSDEEEAQKKGPEILNDYRINMDENGKAEMKLLIPASIGNFEKIGNGYAVREDASWTSYGWILEGACNTRNDWAEIVGRSSSGESLGLRITYQLEALNEEELANLPEDIIVL